MILSGKVMLHIQKRYNTANNLEENATHLNCNANTIRLVIILFSRKRTNNIHFRFARLPLIFKTENKFQNLYWKVFITHSL